MRHIKGLLAGLALALCLGAPAEAVTIGGYTLTPIHSTVNNAHATTHTVTLTGNTAIPAGDVVAIFSTAHLNSTADSIIPTDSVSDTGWVTKQCPSASATGYATAVHLVVTTGLASGQSVSISDGAAAAAFTDGQLSAFGIHGGKTSGTIDEVAVAACSANATSVNSAAVTSVAGAVSGDLLLSIVGTIGVSLGTITEDAAWTNVLNTGDTSIIYAIGGKVNAGTGAVTRTVTWSGSARPYYMAVMALQPAAAPPPPTTRPLFQSIP